MSLRINLTGPRRQNWKISLERFGYHSAIKCTSKKRTLVTTDKSQVKRTSIVIASKLTREENFLKVPRKIDLRSCYFGRDFRI